MSRLLPAWSGNGSRAGSKTVHQRYSVTAAAQSAADPHPGPSPAIAGEGRTGPHPPEADLRPRPSPNTGRGRRRALTLLSVNLGSGHLLRWNAEPVQGATLSMQTQVERSPAMTAEAVVSVRGLTKRYGSLQAVDGISFDVAAGTIFGMLGPNGAGKTTTVEMLEGLRDPDAGSARILGLDALHDQQAIKQRIGVSLQSPALFPRLTVYEVLDLFGSFYEHAVRPDPLIETLGLQESRNKQTKFLSGGQQQRLSVALALVNEPEIVFLDEPTTGLDPQARINLWTVIEGVRAAGRTVFLTTHYLEEAERLCDRVAIVDHGAIIALGSPSDLIAENFSETAILF